MTSREILFLIVTVLLISAAVALIPTAPRNAAPAVTAVKWDAVRDDPNERLKISWASCALFPSGKSDTWIQRHLEQVFNVEFDPIFMDVPTLHNRQPLMFSGGDIPDLCWHGEPLAVQRCIHQGFVLELPYELILKHAPTYVKNLNRYGPQAWLYSRYKGRNYGIPTWASGDVFPLVDLWRKDWLAKVGITKVPDTLDEFHTALWKFRHEDPDGNGVKDTYGTCPEPWWGMFFQNIFSAFSVLPQDLMMRDGRIVWGGIQPEAREALALLRQWYAEDLFDPDFAAASASSPTLRKFSSGRIGYYYGSASWHSLDLNNPGSIYTTMKQVDPRVELVPGPALIGLDGKRHARVWGGPGHVVWFSRDLAKQPEKVIRVLKIIEAFAANPDLFIASRLGKRGEHWEWSAQRGVHLLPPYDQPPNDKRNLLSIKDLENCWGFFSFCSVPLSETEPLLPKGMPAWRKTYSDPAWGMMNALGKSDVVPSAATLEDLRAFQIKVYTQIIRGDKPLAYFEEFAKVWRERGGDALLAEANQKLAEREAIYRTVGVIAAPTPPATP